jgi:hypothetical protein
MGKLSLQFFNYLRRRNVQRFPQTVGKKHTQETRAHKDQIVREVKSYLELWDVGDKQSRYPADPHHSAVTNRSYLCRETLVHNVEDEVDAHVDEESGNEETYQDECGHKSSVMSLVVQKILKEREDRGKRKHSH